ncbi:MAG: outer membrane protein assembly factor [Prolixibacteraceae bacterium]|nr:outer membrane protein assembly factor [Prolixibacteraceae bacterium]
MKRTSLFLFLIFAVATVCAQDNQTDDNKKTGWNFGALPTTTYNSDLGFQYGALVNLFHYGDGSTYPKYLHNVYIEASRFTKGSAIYRLSYDSEYLIPGIRVTSDLAYLPDYAFDFYGFNGYEARYNSSWEENFIEYDKGKMFDDEDDTFVINPNYKSRLFYRYQNKNFRFKTDIQIPFRDKRFRGLVGFNLQNYSIGRIDIDRANQGKESKKFPKLDDVKTLYDHYVDWGIISEEEADGGFIPLLKAGLVFDTRDNEANPMSGMWTEAFLFGAPEILGAESGFMKFNITHRQYFTLVERDLSLAYRLGYQTTIDGDVPFYYQTQIETSKKKDMLGLGGSKTLRGINRNRIVADGFVYGNVELRWKAVHFRFINQNFYIGLNGFYDFGQVTKKIDVQSNFAHWSMPLPEGYFNFEHDGNFHSSAGAGLRIVMNENFVVAVDYGMALDPQDGNSGLYIGLDYLF